MQKQKILKTTAILVSTFLLLFSFQNCADQTFSSTDGSNFTTDTGGPNCRRVLEEIQTPVELVYVVDMSGSNKTINGQPGSDPDKSVRTGSITTFYNTFKIKLNFFWTLISFAGNNAKTWASNAGADEMANAINSLIATNDSGATPYMPALNSARDAIQNDPNPNALKKYVVVVWSDGLPNPAVSDSDLSAKVAEIVALHPGRVSLNTVYYGPIDPEASGRLSLMAQVGGGNFLDTNMNGTGTAFSITDLVVVPGEVCD